MTLRKLKSFLYAVQIVCLLSLMIVISGCGATKRSTGTNVNAYTPVDKALFDKIVELDSLFFGAYNTCDVNLQTYASFFSEDIEFYHDKGGVMTSKADIVEATRKNVCGRVTRQLVAGSLEVYPIANYGAVQIGYHTFRNNTEPYVASPKAGRFVVTWKHENTVWKITRVISLH